MHRHLKRGKDSKSKTYMVSNDKLNIDVLASLIGTSYYLEKVKKKGNIYKPAVLFEKKDLETKFGIVKLLKDLGIDLDSITFKNDLSEEPERVCLLDYANVDS